MMSLFTPHCKWHEKLQTKRTDTYRSLQSKVNWINCLSSLRATAHRPREKIRPFVIRGYSLRLWLHLLALGRWEFCSSWLHGTQFCLYSELAGSGLAHFPSFLPLSPCWWENLRPRTLMFTFGLSQTLAQGLALQDKQWTHHCDGMKMHRDALQGKGAVGRTWNRKAVSHR